MTRGQLRAGARGTRQSGSVTSSDVPIEFDAWMHAVTTNPASPPDDQGELDSAAVQWLRDIYETHGPISREAVEELASAHLTALAHEAIDAVVADLHRTTSYRPSVRFEMMRDSPTVVINDGYTSPSMMEWGRLESIAEIAGYFQEQLADDIGNWPVCRAHDAGTYARVRDDHVAWWCRPGNHDLAHVGSLDASSVRRNDPEPIAIDVELTLRDDTDPRAPGGEVTVALCGHWEHEGPCRWPHNSRINADVSPAQLRTVIVIPAPERDEVVSSIEARLRDDTRWSVVKFETTDIHDDEQDLAERLAQST